MALYTQDGLRFENQEEAVHWFISTLEEKTPLGSLYEKLHEQDWAGYSLQATGLNDKEIHLSLDKPDFSNKIFNRISYNTYGNNDSENTESGLVIENIRRFILSIDIARIAYYETIAEVKKNIEPDETIRISSFDDINVAFQIEKTMESEVLVFAITDEVSGKQYSFNTEFNEYGRLDVERLKHNILSIFAKKAEGKFNIEHGTIGTTNIDDVIGFAIENDKTLKLEIID